MAISNTQYTPGTFSSVIHLRKHAHLSRNALYEAAEEFAKLDPPPAYKDAKGDIHPLYLTPSRDPARGMRNRVLRAIHAHLLKDHESAEICWSGHVYVALKKVIRVKAHDDITILDSQIIEMSVAQEIAAKAGSAPRPQRD